MVLSYACRFQLSNQCCIQIKQIGAISLLGEVVISLVAIRLRSAKDVQDVLAYLEMVATDVGRNANEDILWITPKFPLHRCDHLVCNLVCCASPTSMGQCYHLMNRVKVTDYRTISDERIQAAVQHHYEHAQALDELV
ncbi:MAG: hypothetical protein M3Z08_09615 [Chloroflexota bacterium]|nr:hypothetical protein [Chloroflexota bacterium]